MSTCKLPALRKDPGHSAHQITPDAVACNREYQTWEVTKEGEINEVTVRTLEPQNIRGQNFYHPEASRDSGGNRKFGSALETTVSIPGINA